MRDERLKILEGDAPVSPDAKRHPLAVVLDSVRSAYNVGAMIRTAECAGVERMYICGISATPPNRRLTKTALGAASSLPWEYRESAFDTVLELKRNGYRIISLETTNRNVSLWETSFTPPCALVFGHEVTGVGMDILEISDEIVKIPVFGRKNSLNVATAFGITLYEALRKVTNVT